MHTIFNLIFVRIINIFLGEASEKNGICQATVQLCSFFHQEDPRGSEKTTLECDIDHTVGLFGMFCLFHTCIDQKVHHVVYYSHLDSRVV